MTKDPGLVEGGPWCLGAGHTPGSAVVERPLSSPTQGLSRGLPVAQDKDTG